MKKKDEKLEITGIWRFLHHLLSGAIIFVEGIVLLLFKENFLFSLIFIAIGAVLFIDDLLAETIDISIFNNIHSNPKRLKLVGLLFFIFMEIFFILILFS
ncbi:MAG: hypothetical protein ACQERB_01340 [Promethearchaeati archaeon]